MAKRWANVRYGPLEVESEDEGWRKSATLPGIQMMSGWVRPSEALAYVKDLKKKYAPFAESIGIQTIPDAEGTLDNSRVVINLSTWQDTWLQLQGVKKKKKIKKIKKETPKGRTRRQTRAAQTVEELTDKERLEREQQRRLADLEDQEEEALEAKETERLAAILREVNISKPVYRRSKKAI